MRNKKGISLIVLIITIIVVIILAAVVILTLSKNNPIESAKEARFKEDVRTFQDELALYISKQYANAGGHWDGNINAKTYDEIINYIPSFTKKYEGKFEIQKKNLVYTSNLNDIEKEYAKNLNINNKKSILPDEYRQVEYIESANAQWINTKVISSTQIQTNIEFEYTDFNTSYNRLFGSAYVEGSQYGVRGSVGNGGVFHVELPNSAYGDLNSILLEKNKKYYITFNENKKVYINDLEYSFSLTNNVIGSQKIFLFSHDGRNSPSSLRLYSCKMYDNNILIRDFIPCYSTTTVKNIDGIQVPANTKGLFDTVEGKFYTNQGTGEDFRAGPAVN